MLLCVAVVVCGDGFGDGWVRDVINKGRIDLPTVVDAASDKQYYETLSVGSTSRRCSPARCTVKRTRRVFQKSSDRLAMFGERL